MSEIGQKITPEGPEESHEVIKYDGLMELLEDSETAREDKMAALRSAVYKLALSGEDEATEGLDELAGIALDTIGLDPDDLIAIYYEEVSELEKE
jgi:hypothetical protein